MEASKLYKEATKISRLTAVATEASKRSLTTTTGLALARTTMISLSNNNTMVDLSLRLQEGTEALEHLPVEGSSVTIKRKSRSLPTSQSSNNSLVQEAQRPLSMRAAQPPLALQAAVQLSAPKRAAETKEPPALRPSQ